MSGRKGPYFNLHKILKNLLRVHQVREKLAAGELGAVIAK
jgi:hypothetical protein